MRSDSNSQLVGNAMWDNLEIDGAGSVRGLEGGWRKRGVWKGGAGEGVAHECCLGRTTLIFRYFRKFISRTAHQCYSVRSTNTTKHVENKIKNL